MSLRRQLTKACCVGALAVWVVKLLRVTRSVDIYRQYWAVPRGEPDGLLYVALGDSAAQGVGASQPELGYVGLLAEHMRQRTGKPVEVLNLSRSGATLQDLIRDQLPRLAALTPDVVTVAIGGNDVRYYDGAQFARDVCTLTDGLPAGTAIADVPYFMHGRWARDAAEATRVLADCAHARGLVTVGLHEAMRARGGWAMATDFSADWFHPDDRGHRVWADAFWSALSSVPTFAPPGARLAQ
jgi:acyl-CoA thioesterase-1